jgi:hypothetical protein
MAEGTLLLVPELLAEPDALAVLEVAAFDMTVGA